ncbi:MAG TPA: AAA family ATPase, partial [Phnomibacter sp.]|nr:AAA family ATPase [Phnomibacter sp.]
MLQSLRQALEVSPNNIPLRLTLASLLLAEHGYEEAASHYQQILLQQTQHREAQLGLAHCFVATGKYSAAMVIYETMEAQLTGADLLRFIQCLVKENNYAKAAPLYQSLIAVEPGLALEELDKIFRLPGQASLNDDAIQHHNDWMLEKPSINFNQVGGMQAVKDEISLKIIQPIKHADLYKAYGKKTGGGILLYGPPGCGKTFIAKATAGQIERAFMSIGLHDILDMWIGNSEKNLHEVFETARQHAPCVLFIDEVDALGASRSDLKQSAMRHTINQFLAEMDGVASSNEGILILAATNAPWHVDAAFRRPGRFDRVIFVPPPDEAGRTEILQAILSGKPIGQLDYKKVAAATAHFSGADLTALVDRAIEQKLMQSMDS